MYDKKYEDENSTYNCDFFFFNPLPFVFICDNTVRNDTSYENICKRKNENIIEFTGCISGWVCGTSGGFTKKVQY